MHVNTIQIKIVRKTLPDALYLKPIKTIIKLKKDKR